MPYTHQSNFRKPNDAATVARRLEKRTGVGIAGFRTVLGKYKPGSTKSEMERAFERDKKITDMKDGNKVTHIGEVSVGFYSNTTPALPRKKEWNIDTTYVSESGTYSSLKLSPTSAKLLYSWMAAQGVENIVPQDEMHVTVVWSEKELNGYLPNETSFMVPPASYEWKVLGNPPALVLSFYSQQLNDKYKVAKMLGAESKFPYFIQHVTVSYTWDHRNDMSQLELPPFPIMLVKETVKPLTEDARSLSRLPELKAFTKRNGWQLRMTNSRDVMIFVKGNMELFLFPEVGELKSYHSGLRGFMAGPVRSQEYQWKLEGLDPEPAYGLTAVELDTHIKAHKRGR